MSIGAYVCRLSQAADDIRQDKICCRDSRQRSDPTQFLEKRLDFVPAQPKCLRDNLYSWGIVIAKPEDTFDIKPNLVILTIVVSRLIPAPRPQRAYFRCRSPSTRAASQASVEYRMRLIPVASLKRFAASSFPAYPATTVRPAPVTGAIVAIRSPPL
jgi:hypothetical protein